MQETTRTFETADGKQEVLVGFEMNGGFMPRLEGVDAEIARIRGTGRPKADAGEPQPDTTDVPAEN